MSARFSHSCERQSGAKAVLQIPLWSPSCKEVWKHRSNGIHLWAPWGLRSLLPLTLVRQQRSSCQSGHPQGPPWGGEWGEAATRPPTLTPSHQSSPCTPPPLLRDPRVFYGLWRIRDSWILPWTQCSCLLPAWGLRAHSSGFQRGDCHPSGGVPPGRLARGVLCCFPPSLSECSKESSWGLLTRVQVSNSVTLELPKLDFICSSVCGQAGSSDF